MNQSDPSLKLFPSCPVRTTFELLGGKWRYLIIEVLAQGPRRYGELKRSLEGISDKVLAKELQIMLDNLLIEREEETEGQLAVTYRLSELGETTLPLLGEIRAFGLQYRAQVYARQDSE